MSHSEYISICQFCFLSLTVDASYLDQSTIGIFDLDYMIRSYNNIINYEGRIIDKNKRSHRQNLFKILHKCIKLNHQGDIQRHQTKRLNKVQTWSLVLSLGVGLKGWIFLRVKAARENYNSRKKKKINNAVNCGHYVLHATHKGSA